MSRFVFEALIFVFGLTFTIAFFVIVVPPLLQSGDVIGAFAAGFVNPFSSGYSLDVILCALILVTWIIHERTVLGVKHGWIAIVLSIAPGVATGLAIYLLLRSRQLNDPSLTATMDHDERL